MIAAVKEPLIYSLTMKTIKSITDFLREERNDQRKLALNLTKAEWYHLLFVLFLTIDIYLMAFLS